MALRKLYDSRFSNLCSMDWKEAPAAKLPSGRVSKKRVCRREEALCRETWCGRRESNPHSSFESSGFSCRPQLRRRDAGRNCTRFAVLHYPFALSRMVSGLGAARLAHAPANFVTPVGLAKNAHTPCTLPRRECSRSWGDCEMGG